MDANATSVEELLAEARMLRAEDKLREKLLAMMEDFHEERKLWAATERWENRMKRHEDLKRTQERLAHDEVVRRLKAKNAELVLEAKYLKIKLQQKERQLKWRDRTLGDMKRRVVVMGEIVKLLVQELAQSKESSSEDSASEVELTSEEGSDCKWDFSVSEEETERESEPVRATSEGSGSDGKIPTSEEETESELEPVIDIICKVCGLLKDSSPEEEGELSTSEEEELERRLELLRAINKDRGSEWELSISEEEELEGQLELLSATSEDSESEWMEELLLKHLQEEREPDLEQEEERRRDLEKTMTMEEAETQQQPLLKHLQDEREQDLEQEEERRRDLEKTMMMEEAETQQQKGEPS